MSVDTSEMCSICWRDFSSELVPIIIPCGHSFCEECIPDMKTCALCRKRVGLNHSKPRNYSLLSLLDKITNIKQKETREQNTQVSPRELQQIEEIPLFQRSRTTLDRVLKLDKQKSITFKLSQHSDGTIKGLGINFK